MVYNKKKIFCFLYISHLYCLISGWFNGDGKLDYPSSYFWHFLAWWCVWNSVITIFFVLWKAKNSKSNTYFSQIFSLIVMISNFITMLIYGLGLIIWLATSLTTSLGITDKIIKQVPIPSHRIGKMEVGKVIQWWLYSPVWHFIAPIYFIVWFFRNEQTKLLKKKIKLTFLLCLIQPTIWYSYGYLRSRLTDKKYIEKFDARWVLEFLSAKKMSAKLGLVRNYRFIWRIILFIFWFSLFSLITYFTLRYKKRLKNYLLVKKNNSRNLSNLRQLGNQKK